MHNVRTFFVGAAYTALVIVGLFGVLGVTFGLAFSVPSPFGPLLAFCFLGGLLAVAINF
jgi:hypothetical protein